MIIDLSTATNLLADILKILIFCLESWKKIESSIILKKIILSPFLWSYVVNKLPSTYFLMILLSIT